MMDLFFPSLFMNVQHYEKGMVYTDKELLLLARKIGKLATHCKRLKDEASYIRIETERRDTKKAQDSVKVMVTIELPQKTLRAESRRPDAIEALDRCSEKLEPQLEKYKARHITKGRTVHTKGSRSKRA